MLNRGQQVIVIGPSTKVESSKSIGWTPNMDATLNKKAIIADDSIWTNEIDNLLWKLHCLVFDDDELKKYEGFLFKESWLKPVEEHEDV